MQPSMVLDPSAGQQGRIKRTKFEDLTSLSILTA